MTYFLRALRDASKSWPWLLAAFLCSAGVAGLWGANIAALFPIIEVTLNGESLQDWNEKRIADAESKLESNQQEIHQLRDRLTSGRAELEQQDIQNKRQSLHGFHLQLLKLLCTVIALFKPLIPQNI